MTGHVLVIDDDIWFARQHERTLLAGGYSVTTATDALAALAMIDDRRPSVIVLDMFLPAANAVTLLHELASHADLATIPIIMCSTSGADLQALKNGYGVAVILDKTTMQPADLVAAVCKVLL